MGYLEDLRVREHARKLSRTWAAAAAGQSGLPTQMMPVRQGGVGQPLVVGGQRSDSSVGSVGQTVTLSKAGMTVAGTVVWDAGVVRGGGFGVVAPDPVAGMFGYYDFHVRVTSNGGPLRGLTVSATGSETVALAGTPFCTEWRGVVPHVLASPGDALTVDLGWTGTADVDVELTVGVVEPLASLAESASSMPLEVDNVCSNEDPGTESAVTLTLSPPEDVQLGQILVCSVNGGSSRSTGSVQEWTIDPAFTEFTAIPTGSRSRFTAGWKVADASDVDGTATYSWTYNGSNGPNTVTGKITNLRRSGLTFGDPVAEWSGASPSVLSSPLRDGEWTLAFGAYHLAQTTSGSPSGSWSEGIEIASCISSGTRKPRLRTAVSDSSPGVVWSTSGVNNSWLVAVGVS